MTKAEEALTHLQNEPVLIIDPLAARFTDPRKPHPICLEIPLVDMVDNLREKYPDLIEKGVYDIADGIRGVRYDLHGCGPDSTEVRRGNIMPTCLYNQDDLQDLRRGVCRLLDIAIVNNKQLEALKESVQGVFDNISARTNSYIRDSIIYD